MSKNKTRISYKFKQIHKLRKRKEFLNCYRQGVRYQSPNFILFAFHRKQDLIGFRLGCTVTKKIGKAVFRNRIKRVIREFFRLYQHKIYLDLDFVVVPKKGIKPEKVSFWQVEKEISPLLTKIQKDFSQGEIEK